MGSLTVKLITEVLTALITSVARDAREICTCLLPCPHRLSCPCHGLGLAEGLVRTISIVGGCSISIKLIILFGSVHRRISHGLGEGANAGGLRHG